eukprot:Clim_evm38s152 gene=Clim_evmTU38s152
MSLRPGKANGAADYRRMSAEQVAEDVASMVDYDKVTKNEEAVKKEVRRIQKYYRKGFKRSDYIDDKGMILKRFIPVTDNQDPIWVQYLNLLFRVWWMFSMFLGVLSATIVSSLFHMIPGIELRNKHRFSVWWTHISFMVSLLWSAPWIRVTKVSGSFDMLDHPSMIVMNHCSEIDGIIFPALCPGPQAQWLKVLLKASLFKVPVFGTLCKNIGHFAVHFSGKKQGDFSVDKKAQANVMKDVEKHVANGGILACFPEGQLNPTPEKLQMFRRGSFQVAVDNKLALYGCVMLGQDDAWPLDSWLGGGHAHIFYSIIKICDDAGQFDAPTLCELAQTKMQEETDRVALVKGKYTEHWIDEN